VLVFFFVPVFTAIAGMFAFLILRNWFGGHEKATLMAVWCSLMFAVTMNNLVLMLTLGIIYV